MIIKRIALSILAIVSVLHSIKAQQYPTDEQYQSVAPPATPIMPAYGQSVVDNSVTSPIEITRVTEPQGNWYPLHEYSKTQVWNSDQTMYKISSWKVYNSITYQEIQELSSMYHSYWSNTNPDLIWSFREGGTIKKHFIATNSTQNVATITKLDGTAYEYVMLGPGEGNIDNNDHYVAFACKDGQDLDIVVFDLQNLQILNRKKFVGAWANGPSYGPEFIDWVSVSQSGDYIVVMWTNPSGTTNGYYTDQNGMDHFGVEIYNTANITYQRRIVDVGHHGDLGYAVDGDEVLVQYKAGTSGVFMYKLNGGGATTITTNSNFSASGHISCRNINRQGWAYVTLDYAANSGQLVAIKLDNSGLVEHFGHHFSNNGSYDQSPMAVVSPNGDKMCFKSDFSTSPNDGDVAYDFFANVANNANVKDEQENNINIYPNPAYDFLKIESKTNITNITIYSITGQKIKNFQVKNSNISTISVNNLNAGFYYLEITTEKLKYAKRIIIQ